MLPKDLADLAALQDGVVTRRQALSAGLSVRQVEWRISSGRWERAHAGVYQTQPGRRDQASAESAATLACGAGAVLWQWSVAHHLGLTRAAPKQIRVSVPSTRRVVEPLGVTVHRTVGAVDASEPWQWPPRTSDDQTVIDIAALGTADDAVAIAALACQRGVTWHEAHRAELERPRRPSMGKRSTRCARRHLCRITQRLGGEVRPGRRWGARVTGSATSADHRRGRPRRGIRRADGPRRARWAGLPR